MLRLIDIIPRRPCSIITVTGFILCLSIPLLFFHASPLHTNTFQKFEGWLRDRVIREPGIPTVAPLPKFYDWDTRSEFSLVTRKNARDATIAELCRSFPAHLLEVVQPVLKTAHTVLRERVGPQLEGVSACLDNLIIVSDLEEEIEGHKTIDIIADIPPSLLEEQSSQFEYYHIQKAFAANNSLDILDATEYRTWKLDKFKFLTQISRTWRISPDRRWYVFYEDDTYVLWDNVFRLLSHLDPDELLYFGAPSPGCTTIEGEKTWFGNGGPGYILSRGAMRRLVQDDWDSTGHYLGPKLQERYWDRTWTACCGDGTLGCILWMKGISLSGLWPMFNGRIAHVVPFSERVWCQPAITMHKELSEEDMLGIWRWEWEHRQIHRPLLWRDLAVSYWNFADLTVRENWDNTGRESVKATSQSKSYSHDPHESFDACRRACEAMPKCLQYNYHLRKCKIDKSLLRMGEHKEPQLGKIGKDLNEEESEMDWQPDDLVFRAGWVQERVRKWIDEHPCTKAHWVRPSVERVF